MTLLARSSSTHQEVLIQPSLPPFSSSIGKPIAEVAEADAKDVDRAVSAARAALDNVWGEKVSSCESEREFRPLLWTGHWKRKGYRGRKL